MTVGRFCRFVFVLISWVVMAGAAMADCVSVDSVTKCARLPAANDWNFSAFSGVAYGTDGLSWSLIYNGEIVVSGTSSGGGFYEDVVCTISYPFKGDYTVSFEPSFTFADYTAQICTGEVKAMGWHTPSVVALDGDVCPDGFYTVPYEISCGEGFVDTAGVPQCDSDVSGESCLIGNGPTAVPCALGISELKLSAGVSIPLWAERNTTPALGVGYNGGVCYADALVGQEINTLNIAYNDMVYHLVAQVSSGGDTGGGDTGGGDTGGDNVAEKYVFEFNNLYADSGSGFRISAAGTFYVDWGGVEQVIEKNNTDRIKYSCPKSSGASCDVVRLGGRATAYSATEAAIWFDDCYDHDMQMTHIDGCLGCIFPTLADGSQPRFISTFSRCQIETIPENLFDGISGAPVSDMFNNTFYDCSGLTAIPAGLFAGISGAPASGMFKGTFEMCRSLTSIPENLFAGLDVNAPLQDGTFAGMFMSCSGLTGSSARIGGRYLYEIWPDATSSQVGGMYLECPYLDDYFTMPEPWSSY